MCRRGKKTPNSQLVRKKLWRPLKQRLIETILMRNVFSSEKVAEKFLEVALIGAEVDELFETKQQKRDREELEETRIDVKINGPSFPKEKLTFQVGGSDDFFTNTSTTQLTQRPKRISIFFPTLPRPILS